ncbi:MAG: tetratricopeptide repeat protein [Verrucomicrobia bacterium]|nr:tetratricopeptide repeat protein [Verrucomicrobiota bacterium]
MRRVFILFCAIALVCCLTLTASAVEMTVTRSVAILDFENADKEGKADDWLCAGMAETLITKLRQVKDLRLVERKQILKAMEELDFTATDFFDTDKSAELAKFLKVDVLLVGGFQHYGESIRITARFVDVATGEVLEAVDIKGEMDTIFDLQDQLALKLIETMGIATTRSEMKAVAKQPTTSLSALELYSKALDATDPAESIPLFEAAIEADPQYKEAYNDLAVVHMDQGDFASAVELLKKALEIDSSYFLPHFNLGVCYNRLGQPDEAVRSYTRAIDSNPAYINAYLAAAEVLIAKGDNAAAIGLARQAVDLDPADVRGINLWGNALYGQKEYEEAIKKYEEVLELDPEGAYAYYNIANCHADLGRTDAALDYYGKALEADSEYALAYYRRAGVYHYTLDESRKAVIDYTAYIRLVPGDPDGYVGLARAYANLGDADNAKDAYAKAVELRDDEPNALNELANLLYNEASYVQAEHLYLQALRADPDFVYAYHNLGRLYAYARQDQDTAADYFTRALKIDRNYSPSLVEASLVELRRQNWDNMISYLMRGRKLEPGNSFWHYYLGYAYDEKAQQERAQGETRTAQRYNETAAKHLGEAARLDPNDPDIPNLLGNLKLNEGKPAEAIPYYEQALKLNADHLYATVNLAAAGRRLARYDDAERLYKRALEIEPSYAYAAHELASMYDQDLQRVEDAIAAYKRYLELVGEDAQVESRIKELQEFGE